MARKGKSEKNEGFEYAHINRRTPKQYLGVKYSFLLLPKEVSLQFSSVKKLKHKEV
jgi:hypothetical protein